MPIPLCIVPPPPEGYVSAPSRYYRDVYTAYCLAAGHPVKAARSAESLRGRVASPDPRPQEVARLLGYEVALASASRCQRCGREIHDDLSVQRGVGPDCWEILMGRAG